MISREWIKTAIHNFYYGLNHTPTEEDIQAYIDVAPSAITEKIGRWIPVSERLPEDGTWNMFTDGKQISVERFKLDAINHFFPEGRWFSFDEAVAWMPLPLPYKAESEE